ncbi:MAG: hypothetical protein AAB795_03945 [Patescibacteria group bacterium]
MAFQDLSDTYRSRARAVTTSCGVPVWLSTKKKKLGVMRWWNLVPK